MPTRSYFAASALLLTALGCRDDARSPAEPAAAMPEAGITQTITLVSGNAPIGERDSENQVSEDGGATFHDAYVIELAAWASPLPGSRWITAEPNFGEEAPAITMLFRRTFTLPAGYRNPSFTIEMFSDNFATVFLNGIPIGQQSHEAINFLEPSSSFTAPPGILSGGSNTLDVEVTNLPITGGNAAGLDYRATITSGQGPAAGVRLITAGGTFTQPFPEPVGSEVTFSVDAIKHPDGSFNGRFYYVTRIHRPSPLPVNQIRTAGVVDCFVIEGDLVILGGRIIRSNFDDIGQPIVINLTDRSDSPDLASGIAGPPGSFEGCAQRTRIDQFPVDGVNLHTSLR